MAIQFGSTNFDTIHPPYQEELPEAVSVIIDSDDSSHSKRKKYGSSASSASSASGSTVSVGDLSDDNFLQSQTPKKTQGNHSLSYLEKYKPLDLPADFDLLTTFGKRVDKAVTTDFKQPGSLPYDLTKKVVSQVTDHIESENPRPSKQTIEWLAWRYCLKYPCLQQINPLMMLGDKTWNSKPFKEWGLFAEKIRRALENKRYQQKRRASISASSLVEIKRLKSNSDQERDIDDDASLARHSKRLQDELGKSSPDEELLKELMDAEFQTRRSFVTKIDLQEELLRILKFENKVKCSGVEMLLKAWDTQYDKLKAFISQQFSLRKDDITGAVVLKTLPQIFVTKVSKKKDGKSSGVFAVLSSDEEIPAALSPNDPYLLVNAGEAKDCHEAYTVMVGDQKYCDISEGKDALGHAIVQLLALFYVYHLEYPQSLRNTYFYLQQFVLGDHDVSPLPRILNSYHESVQQYLVFANSL